MRVQLLRRCEVGSDCDLNRVVKADQCDTSVKIVTAKEMTLGMDQQLKGTFRPRR
jgi:hypothetical protein